MYSDLKILVIGDIILDKYIIGKSSRLSPEAPVPIINVVKRYSTLGGSSNVCSNIYSLSAKTNLLGVIGNDNNGKEVLNKLSQICDNNYVVIDQNRQTTSKTRLICGNQQVARIDDETCNKITNLDLKKIGNDFDGVIISDYAKGVVTYNLIKEIKKKFADKPIFLDPKTNNIQEYRNIKIDLIKPNKKEAEEISNVRINNTVDLIKACNIIYEKTLCKYVVVTLSNIGSSLWCETSRENILLFPSKQNHQVIDICGAGDTFIASLILEYAKSNSINKAMQVANVCSGIVVEKFGTAVVDVSELKRFSFYKDMNMCFSLTGKKRNF